MVAASDGVRDLELVTWLQRELVLSGGHLVADSEELCFEEL